MKTLLVLFALVAALVLLTGCVAITKRQLEGKLPRINAAEVSIEASTIYGVHGTLEEKNVKWEGDKKSVESSVLEVNSPIGRYKRTIKGADASLPDPEK